MVERPFSGEHPLMTYFMLILPYLAEFWFWELSLSVRIEQARVYTSDSPCYAAL